MKKTTIEELAYFLKEAKNEDKPSPIFFLGAGASRSGGIFLASEIVKDILGKYSDNPRIQRLQEKDQTYVNLMDCIGPNARNTLLKEYVKNAKINVAHIYIAQLMVDGYADYILTVNFDNLMQRALALFNEFSPIYDMAILKDLTTTSFKEKSIVHLHGQHHGLWLLNTQEEMDKVKEVVPPILNKISNERPWIFIGYSGDDPIFDHIKKLGRFDNGLYWVAHYDQKPSDNVRLHLLDKPNTNSYIIEGYDADSFMLKLNKELGLLQPEIIDKPFSSLKLMLNNIVDIDDKDHFKGVRKRLDIAKSQTTEAIQQFEYGKIDSRKEMEETSAIDLLKKEIIDFLITENYKNIEHSKIIEKARPLNDLEINGLLSGLFNNWGVYLGKLAETKSGKESEDLYLQAFEKLEKAVEIKPDYHESFNNWGNFLGKLAKTKSGKESESLYIQAFEKFEKVIEIKPDYHEAFNNWGIYLGNFARTKSGKESESLYLQAFEKIEKAVEIKPDYHLAFNNWGIYLGNFARTKSGKASEDLYLQAFEKFEKAIEIKPDYREAFNNWGGYLGNFARIESGKASEDLYIQAIKKLENVIEIKPDDHEAFNNWGVYLGNLARIKSGKESEGLYIQAIEKLEKAVEIKPGYYLAFNNWGVYLGNLAETKSGKESEGLYIQAFEKFEKAIEIKPDYHEAFNNWGGHLGDLARIKSGKESEGLYIQAFEKFEKAIEITPDYYDAFNNWGVHLGDLARIKSGKESEGLYIQAFEKFEKAIEITPDFHEAFNNWGNFLGKLAKTKSGKESEDLYTQAIEKSEKATALGGISYNLACNYALKQDKINALLILEKTLKKQEIEITFIMQDEDWKALKDDKDFLELINRFKI